MSSEIPAGGPYKAALGMHEPLTVEHLKEARRQLSYYCTAHARFCREFVARMREASLNVARARLEDLSASRDYVGVDKGVIEVAERLVEFYADYIAGLLALHGEDVAVEARADVRVGKLALRRGEIAFLEPGLAARLAVAGLVEPVRSNAISLRSP
ncbi:MAG: hypothetical protein F7B17_05330 [Desulfurococcales archaeon]|nr:hypothetical protein [Desulfurococcales archaeon]